MDVIIADVFRDPKSAKMDELFDPLLEFVDLVLLDPLLEFSIDGGGSFLEDERGGIEIKVVTHVQFVIEDDAGVVCGGLQVKVN